MGLKCWAYGGCLVKGSYDFYPSQQGGLSCSRGPWGDAEGKPPLPCLLGGGEAGILQGPGLLQTSTGQDGQQLGLGEEGGWACLQPWLSGPSSHPSSGRQVKPVVSQFLHEKQLPYNEDTYLARFWLFLSRYEEFMVQTPPITELVGLQ